MPLPSSAQAQRDALEDNKTKEEKGKEAQDKDTKPKTPEPQEDTPTTIKPDEGRVSIARDEYTELRAAADRSRAAEGRAEALRDDLDALKQRLTEIEGGAKGSSQGEADMPSQWDFQKPTYDEDEEKDYGESKPFVRKVVQEVLAEVLPGILSSVNKEISAAKEAANTASESAGATKVSAFTNRVKEKVPEFDNCVNHKNWADFLQAVEDTSGYAYADLIRRNLQQENLKGMINIFNEFKKRYHIEGADTSGYEGAVPSGSGNAEEPTPDNNGKLKFSERKEAHEKYLNKQITYEEYQKVKEKFDKADAEGRVDYDA